MTTESVPGRHAADPEHAVRHHAAFQAFVLVQVALDLLHDDDHAVDIVNELDDILTDIDGLILIYDEHDSTEANVVAPKLEPVH